MPTTWMAKYHYTPFHCSLRCFTILKIPKTNIFHSVPYQLIDVYKRQHQKLPNCVLSLANYVIATALTQSDRPSEGRHSRENSRKMRLVARTPHAYVEIFLAHSINARRLFCDVVTILILDMRNLLG